uniref:Beta-microseminoprotein n=1 Tax=Catagonus wagneri TaxID=51154 RepID=A0A8C3YVI9_9CETA
MKSLLGTLVVLATFVTLCNSQCYLIPNKNVALNECQDLDGVSHPLNSVWKTKDCKECTCGQDAISCCNTAAIPVDYDTDKCQKIFNTETCTFTVVEKKDPGKTCAVTGWVL